jgi:hypothetical protein
MAISINGVPKTNGIADNAVTSSKIADAAVTTGKIANGTIVNIDISDTAAIDPAKIAGTAVITTDSRLSNTRTPSAGTVADSTIVTGGLSPSKITGTAVITTDSRLSDTRTPTDLSVTTGKVADGAITNAKLQYAYVKINNTNVTLGDPTGITISASPSGNITAGDLTGSYPNPTLATVGTAGTYTKVTTDSKGRVTSGTTLSASDIPTLTASKVSDLGTAATKNIPATGDASNSQVVYGTDSRLTDARDPKTNSVVTASIADSNVTNAKLQNASITINNQTVSLGGSVTIVAAPSGTVTGDVTGTLGATTTLTLANTAVTAGTYPKVTVDAKGRVTAGTTLVPSDIPDISATYSTKASPTFTGTVTTPLTGTGTRVAQVSSTGVLGAGLGVDSASNASTIVARDASSNVYASTFYGNLGVTAGGSANVSLGLSGVLTMGATSTISASSLTITAPDVASLSGVGASGTLVSQLANKVTTPSSWTTYTPVLGGTGAALGSGGTVVGSYERIGKTVKVRITFALGTGSTPGSTGLTISLPYAPVGNTIGQCIAVTGGNRYGGQVLFQPAQVAIPLVTPATAGGPSRNITSTVPFTWDSGDQVIISGMYEIA